jgi:hypothetical protein
MLSQMESPVVNFTSGGMYFVSSDSILAGNRARGIEIHPPKYIPECRPCQIIRIELAISKFIQLVLHILTSLHPGNCSDNAITTFSAQESSTPYVS